VRPQAGELTAPPARADLAPLVDGVREAMAARRRVALRGAASWWPELPDGVRALAAAPRGLSRFDPADLVATCGAATPLAELRDALAVQGTFVALDAPGGPDRTLGGALAGASAGPLAAGYGPPRDQVLGLTIVAGNGVVVKSGGRVVKNVAGFDLAKVVIGGFGGMGCIAAVHLRLRALPPADATRAWAGSAARVRDAAARIMAAGGVPAALEALSPALAGRLGLPAQWTLLARALGAEAAVADELAAAAAAAEPAGCEALPAASDAWPAWGPAVGAARVLVRIGADPATWHEAVALAEEHLGRLELVSATVPRGTVRAGAADATLGQMAALRDAAARRGWPVTLERAPAALRTAAGVWGTMSPTALRVARGLRATFDPDGVFEAPLWAKEPGGRGGG
jgi:glycolate oxidase FAD binding subunit